MNFDTAEAAARAARRWKQGSYFRKRFFPMRLRNIPRAEGVLKGHDMVIKMPSQHRGRWSRLFGNDGPIHVEIGMGKGKFILNMAAKCPSVNFIGIERYSSVLLRALEKFDTEGFNALKNVRFIRMYAEDAEEIFAPGEVGRIYLNFPDPWPKTKHAKRRLTSKEFLARYENILQSGGEIELKTDDMRLYDFSLGQAEEAGWEAESRACGPRRAGAREEDSVMTEYEEKYAAEGDPIYRLILHKKEHKVRTGKKK